MERIHIDVKKHKEGYDHFALNSIASRKTDCTLADGKDNLCFLGTNLFISPSLKTFATSKKMKCL